MGGKPIKPMEARLLSEGDAITLGELAVQYVVKGLGAPPAPGSDRWQPPAWAQARRARQGALCGGCQHEQQEHKQQRVPQQQMYGYGAPMM